MVFERERAVSSMFAGLVGIDLGTTYTCLAYLNREGSPISVPNREGALITPSALLIEDNLAIVGQEARRSECVYPDRTAVCIKRDMGESSYAHSLGGRDYRPEILSAIILKRVKEDAENHLGLIHEAVITVPAYFDDVRRKATQDAGRLAGLHILDILNEPTAAALAFAFDRHLRESGSIESFSERLNQREQIALVYDLGGGTFDVAVVRMAPDVFETLATDGDVRLGGRDWDEKLVNHIAQQFLKQHRTDPREDPSSKAFLYQAAELARHSLSVRTSTRVMVAHAGRRLSLEITRQEFESLTAELLLRTEMTTEMTLEAAGLTWKDVDRVLLVGGMTRTPQVREMLKRITGLTPDSRLAADEVVAHGAAIHGGILKCRQIEGGDNHAGLFQHWKKFRTIDVNSHSLGIAVRTENGYANSILIPKNTRLPCSRSKTYHTVAPNQTRVRLRLLEGDAPDADACSLIGDFVVTGLPENLPEKSPFEVECRYGTDGRISLVSRDVTSGRLVETEILRNTTLDDDELQTEAALFRNLRIG